MSVYNFDIWLLGVLGGRGGILVLFRTSRRGGLSEITNHNLLFLNLFLKINAYY